MKALGKPAPTLGQVQRRDGASGPLINGYFDQDGSLIKWPGISTFVDFNDIGHPIQGIYESQKTGNVYVVYSNLLRKIASDGTATTITGTGLNYSGVRASFDEDGSQIFVCNNSRINKVNEGAGTASLISGGTAPDNVTHLFWLQGFLSANGLQSGGIAGDTNFSDDSAGGYALWELFNNETNPDGNLALFKNRDESVAFGAYSVEPSYLDGVTPWSVIQGAQAHWGVRAPYSVVLIADNFMFLTVQENWVRFVRFQHREPVDISRPYESVFGYFTDPANAIATGITWNGAPFYVVRFPIDSRTFIYNIRRNEWTEWLTWDGIHYDHGFPMGAYAFIRGWNKHLIGDSRNATLYELDGSLTQINSTIRTQWDTAAVSHGSIREKRQNSLTFWLAMGGPGEAVGGISYWNTTWWEPNYWVTGWWPAGPGGTAAAAPTLKVNWKSDGQTNFGPGADLKIDVLSEKLYFAKINGGGRYRAREYQFIQDETTSGFVLVDVEEDFTWLSR